MNTTIDAWVGAVAQSPLWHSVADVDATAQERARRVVRICAEIWAGVEVAIGVDPWWDSKFPLRILRWLAEARPRGLDSKTAFRLLTAPFVAEAIRAEATRILLAEGDADSFHSSQVRGRARRIIESAQRRYPSHVRRVMGAPRDWQRVISRWILHQAVRGDESTWTGRPGNLVRDRLGDFDPVVLGAIDLAPFVGCDESRLLSASGPNQVGVSESAGLLARAGALALDLRQVDEAVLDGELATVTEIRALVRRDAWRRSPPTVDLQGDCRHRLAHYCVSLLVERAGRVLDRLRADSPEPLGSTWPATVSTTRLVPAVGPDRQPYFILPHVHFRLDHRRIREMLMGQRLYGDPALALRELYQNALDACRYRRARQAHLAETDAFGAAPYRGVIEIRRGVADGRHYVECIDNGVGMSRGLVEHVFAVAGQRFHDQVDFARERPRWGPDYDFVPNSQHGIGVLSYFMLADEVEVETHEI